MITRKSVIFGIVAAVLALGLFWVVKFVGEDAKIAYYEDALATLLNAETVGMDISIETVIDATAYLERETELGLKGGEVPATFVPLVLRGSVEMALPKVGPLTANGEWTVTGRDADDYIASAETRLDGTGRLYMRLHDLPPTEDDASIVDIAKLNDVWFSINRSMLFANAEWLGPVATTVNAPYDADPLRESLRAHPPFVQAGRFEDTLIDGRPMAHYGFTPNPSGIERLMVLVASSVAGRELSEQERDALVNSARGRTYAVEALVDKKKRTLDILKIVVIPPLDSEDENVMGITIRFTSLGEPVEVVAPEDARPFDVVVSTHLLPGTDR